ncbi:carbonic anhydrase [Phlegmacium glaucopus]|nr:carbonic anhydrase [Phlegmacium glaucopus]
MSEKAQALLKSNKKWATEVSQNDPNFFPDSAKGQTPHTLWIGCSDSRVPESVITASKPGVIFVQRNIANQLPSDDINVLSVLAYAVGHLGVENVVIAGHSGCGGAAACLNAAKSPDFDPHPPIRTIGDEPMNSPINRWLEPLTLLAHCLQLPDTSPNSLAVVVEENVKAQVENLANTETIKDAWLGKTHHKQKVFIHGWVYHLDNGLLEDLCITRGPPKC